MPPNTVTYTPTTDDWENTGDAANQPAQPLTMRRSGSTLRIEKADSTEEYRLQEEILGTGKCSIVQRVGDMLVVKTPNAAAIQRDTQQDTQDTEEDIISWAVTPLTIDSDLLAEHCKCAFKDYLGMKKVYGDEAAYFFIFREEELGQPILPFRGNEITDKTLEALHGYRMVTKYLPGEDLHHLITPHSSPMESAHILLAAATALQELHKKGIVHLDIKANNIRYDFETQQAYYIDFGEYAEIGEPSRTISEDSEAPHWAPERKVGNGNSFIPATFEMDIFSFGEMLRYFNKEGWQPKFPGIYRFIEDKICAEKPEERPSLEEIKGFLQCELWLQKCLQTGEDDEALQKEILTNASFVKKQKAAIKTLNRFAFFAKHQYLPIAYKKLHSFHKRNIYTTILDALLRQTDQPPQIKEIKRAFSNTMSVLWDAIASKHSRPDHYISFFMKVIQNDDLYNFFAVFAEEKSNRTPLHYLGHALLMVPVVNLQQLQYKILTIPTEKLIAFARVIEEQFTHLSQCSLSKLEIKKIQESASKQIVIILSFWPRNENERAALQETLKCKIDASASQANSTLFAPVKTTHPVLKEFYKALHAHFDTQAVAQRPTLKRG